GGRPYIAWEYSDGETITEYSDRKRLDVDGRLELFLQVCDAVQSAHVKAVMHRDLKPSNVLVTETEDGVPRARIIDFGIAKTVSTEKTGLTATHRFVGTPAYTSPEQLGIGASDVDLRTDVYSLGVLLHELLLGFRPYETDDTTSLSLAEWSRRIVSEELPTPSSALGTSGGKQSEEIALRRSSNAAALRRRLQPDLDWILVHALEPDRDRRYRSVLELAEDIRRHLRREVVLAGPPSLRYRALKFVQRNPGSVLGFGTALLSLLVGVVVAVVLLIETESARKEARKSFEESQLALRNRDIALAQREKSLKKSEGLRLTALAVTLGETERDTAIQVAIEGAKRHESLEARNALYSLFDGFETHRLLNGHEEIVSCLDVAGERLATGSPNGAVRLWELGSGKCLALLLGRGAVNDLSFSPDGKLLVTCSDQPSLWSSKDGRELVRFPVPFRAAAFSSDARVLVSASHDRLVRVWDVRDGRLLKTLKGHTRSVSPVVVEGSGGHAATGSRDGTVRVWDLQTGESRRLEHDGETIRSVDFCPGAQRVLVAAVHRWVKEWDFETGELLRSLDTESRAIRAIYDATGERVAVACLDGKVLLFGRGAEPLHSWKSHSGPVNDVTFGPEGRVLYSASHDKN
ncbi:MAG: WD40 repeat domain-containing serine/threonine-protein kinase, partial [Planctomycetota bacterium]